MDRSRNSFPLYLPGIVALIGAEAFGIFVGSILLAFVLGAFVAFILKRLTVLREKPSTELGFIVISGLGAYAMGDAVRLSGIVVIFFYGIAVER